MRSAPTDRARRPLIPHRLRFALMGLLVIIAFGALFLVGWLPRVSHSRETTALAQPSLQTVAYVRPSNAVSTPALTLPGEIQPYLKTAVYSRVSGTLNARYVDLGDRVRGGQLLATVDVPDLDQELNQGRAALVQSKAAQAQAQTNAAFAQATLKRWEANAQGGALSQQDVDQKRNDARTSQAALNAANAAVSASQANVRRLQAQLAYKHITAPFSGTITQRNVDPGANVVAGGSSTSTSLFMVEQTDKLRVFVNVPQSNVQQIRRGLPVKITVPELPGKTFPATVTRTAGTLDTASRTLQTEIILRNPGPLHAGLYINVTFASNGSVPMTVPDNAVVADDKGLHVIIVDDDDRLHFKPVQVGRDYGTNLEVLSGLTGNERLVANPSDAMRPRQHVKPILAPKLAEPK